MPAKFCRYTHRQSVTYHPIRVTRKLTGIDLYGVWSVTYDPIITQSKQNRFVPYFFVATPTNTTMQFLLVVLSLVSAISALPNGAPACTVGSSAVRNQHLLRKPVEYGRNEDKGYRITLDGSILLNKLNDATFVNLFQFDQEHILLITADSTTHIKGILVLASTGLVDAVDALDTRTPGALTIKNNVTTKESPGCENITVASIVHTNNAEKSSMDMYFKWPSSGQKLFLDVNIVKNNNLTVGSQYAYNQYPVLSGNVAVAKADCGLLKLNIFCPLTFCGILGRLLGLCDN
jgi:hypothetical protein